MESVIKQLVKIGHGMSAEVAKDEPAVAKLLVELSSALDVQYERANTLEAKCAALAAELKQSQIDAGCYKKGMEASNERLVQLAAENVGLNEKMNKLATWPGIEFYSSAWEFNNGDGNAALEFMCDVQTPATDAYQAEMRAQAWIEGNEPAEFGRYWVRYETDVGPQYCSAKWMEHNFCAGSDTNIHKIWLADHSRSINSLKGVTHYTMLPEPIEGGAK